jgi:hypothetical protein
LKRPEEALQRAVCGLLAIYEAKHLLAYCHVPSGGYRTPAEAGILKAMGVKRGIPDLLVWTPNAHSFGIELKGPKGKESDAQILFRSTLESLGHRVYVCWSIEEVEAALRLERVPAVGKIAGGHQADSRRVLEAIP